VCVCVRERERERELVEEEVGNKRHQTYWTSSGQLSRFNTEKKVSLQKIRNGITLSRRPFMKVIAI
jgi:hypothetical protein